MVIKVLLLGDGGIGKTTLAVKAAGNQHNHDGRMTVFFDTHRIKNLRAGQDLVVFDFGGQKHFRTFLDTKSPLLGGASAALVCFDRSRFVTFKNLKHWFNVLEKLPQMPIALVGTKRDKKSVIDQQLIREFMIQKKIDIYLETSSMENYNVVAPFEWAAMVTKKSQISSNSGLKGYVLQVKAPIPG